MEKIMLNRQLVLAAIDHATDVTRALEVARSVAKARGALGTARTTHSR
jgi:hypothetical protein